MSATARKPRSRPQLFDSAVGFPLFAEVLLVGVIVTVVSIPVVTIPAALAAGSAHLIRFIEGRDTGVRALLQDLRSALPGGALVGAVGAIATGLILVSARLAATSTLPGHELVAAGDLLAVLAVVLLISAAAAGWQADAGWRRAVRDAPGLLRGDLVSCGILAGATVAGALLTWQLLPLIVAALGLQVLAITAVALRLRRVDR
jgi:hypothetical protein